MKTILFSLACIFSFIIGIYYGEMRCKRDLQIEKKQINSTWELDSLRSEIFVKDIEIGRYEIILDKIREKDSVIVDDACHNVE